MFSKILRLSNGAKGKLLQLPDCFFYLKVVNRVVEVAVVVIVIIILK